MKISPFGSLLLALAFIASAGLCVASAAAQGVKTLSTGIGKGERVRVKGYSVRFEFAELAGPYLGKIAVVVKDASGKAVVETVSGGPWLLADLAPGSYRIFATAANGKKQSAPFAVEAGRQKVVRLAWR